MQHFYSSTAVVLKSLMVKSIICVGKPVDRHLNWTNKLQKFSQQPKGIPHLQLSILLVVYGKYPNKIKSTLQNLKYTY